MSQETVPSTPRVNPDDGMCDFYLSRKKRFCGFKKRAGNRFCHTHDTSIFPVEREGMQAERSNEHHMQRVPCPINPNHTVYKSRLKHHLQVCPDLRFVTSRLPYYKENLHALRGSVYCAADADRADGGGAKNEERRTHHHLDTDTLNRLITRVREYYFTVVQPQMVLMAEENSIAEGEASAATRKESLKHAPQHRALLRCLQRAMNEFSAGRAAEKTSEVKISGFLELGAGKGGLSVALQEALLTHSFSLPGINIKRPKSTEEDDAPSQPLLVVVDVGNFRRKGDGRVCQTALPLFRLRLNIKDLDLAKALRDPILRKRTRDDEYTVTDASLKNCNNNNTIETSENWVALGKHLCGACTDFALSCITSHDLHTEGHLSVVAVVFATCCHHRCELRHFNSLQSANEAEKGVLYFPGTEYTLSAAEFAAMASMSSWAVSGAFVNEESRITGMCCKRVLDALRLEYLKKDGYRSAFLCQYTTRDVTEENVCILAFR